MKTIHSIRRRSDKHWVGNGFPVISVFSYMELGKELSPFLLLDYAEPYEFPPGSEKRGVGAHPHKGFETVTISYQGEVEHRDSSGGGGVIGPGDVQWMTAARGVMHDEFHSQAFTARGGTFEMAQLWVNLPAKHKGADPGYQNLLKNDIPVVSLPDDAGTLRVIAGEYAGTGGAARTYTPINLWDVTLKAGTEVELPLPEGHTASFLVMRGEVIPEEGREGTQGELVIYHREGEGVQVKAVSDSKLLVMSGEPIDEPIVGQGPFVMNTAEEIYQAYQEVRQGKMGQL